MPNDIEPICGKCKKLMRCKKTGKRVVQSEEMASGAPKVTVWSGDEFECPECGCSVIADFGESYVTHRMNLPPDALEFANG